MASNVFFDKSKLETLAKADNASRVCVFISHRQADAAAAFDLAQYLQNVLDVDVYIDIRDASLQRAVSENDDHAVVRYIEQGIRISTHLLSVISGRTHGSWWVPYEFGAARQQGCSVAHVLLEDIDFLPEYIRISQKIEDKIDFNLWLLDLPRHYIAKANSSYKNINVRGLPEGRLLRHR